MIRSIVVLAAIDWHFMRQRPQHLAREWARRDIDVLFVENTGTRSPALRDLPRIGNRLRMALFHDDAPGDSSDGVRVLSPVLPPYPYSPTAVKWSTQQLVRRIRSHLREKSILPEHAGLLLYIATPLALEIVHRIPWGVVAYDVLNDPKHSDMRVAKSEQTILGQADLIFFASEGLRRQYALDSQGILFRDGFPVDLIASDAPPISSFASLPKPRLLYLGGINRRIWPEAVAALCDAIPNGSVALVGPLTAADAQLPQRPNLHLFKSVTHYLQLAGFLRAADGGILPYRADTYSGRMHPAKLAEYLLFGLPIISVATEEMIRLKAAWPSGSIFLADDPADFAGAISEALSNNTPAAQQERITFAKSQSWTVRAEQFLTNLETAAALRGKP